MEHAIAYILKVLDNMIASLLDFFGILNTDDAPKDTLQKDSTTSIEKPMISTMDRTDKIVYNKWFIIGSVALLFFIVINSGSNNGSSSGSSSIEQSDPIDPYLIYFNSSRSDFARLVKSNLNDPESFKFVETKFRDNGNGTITLIMEFRAKNALGGVITSNAVAEFSKASKKFSNLRIN